MRLFDDIVRNDSISRQNAESFWSYHNRSAEPDSRRVRKLLEELLDEYPKQYRDELIARLRSEEFDGAYFELLFHALLLRHGATVQIHSDDVSDNTRRPDFLASFPCGQKVIFECVVSKDISDSAIAVETAQAKLFDQINKLPTDFWILITYLSHPVPGSPPAFKTVRPFLLRKLAGLDVHKEYERMEPDSDLYYRSSPAHLWQNEDGTSTIEFKFLPKIEALRGNSGSISAYPPKSRMGGSSRAIRVVVDDKATAYGQDRLPYVVAVNSLSPWGHGPQDEIEALFGNRSLGHDGALVRSDGESRNTRVSGVIIGTVWLRFGKERLTLYENPQAKRPVTAVPWRLDRIRLAVPKSEWKKGESVGEVLNLSGEWPSKVSD